MGIPASGNDMIAAFYLLLAESVLYFLDVGYFHFSKHALRKRREARREVVCHLVRHFAIALTSAPWWPRGSASEPSRPSTASSEVRLTRSVKSAILRRKEIPWPPTPAR